MSDDRMIEDAALGWVIALRDPGFEDWDGFEAWMAADPAHADVYHVLAIAEEDLGEMLPPAAPAEVVPAAPNVVPLRRPVTRRLWLGGAIAASIAGLIGYGLVPAQADLYRIETKAGERRSVAMADGTRIILNGGTAITLDRNDGRVATLDRGEALFEVKHDDAHPFRVAMGDDQLLDVGTAFNVVRDGGVIEVQVSEGAVVYNPKGEAVRLDAGNALRVENGQAVRGKVVPGDVAAWRDGRLISDGQSMAEVAAQLTRYTGEHVTAASDVADRPFRGVLSLAAREDIATLGPILGVAVRRTSDGWELAAR